MITIAKAKCALCRVELEKHEIVKHTNKKNYHAECLITFEKRKKDREDLNLYIASLMGVDFPPQMILTQIKRFEETGFKLTGIRLALEYFHEIEGREFSEESGIAIVPHIYDAARSYFLRLAELEKSAREFNPDVYKTQIVKVKIRKQTEKNLIDMDSI